MLTTLVMSGAAPPVSAAADDGCAAINTSSIDGEFIPIPSEVSRASGGFVGTLPGAQAYSAQGKYAKHEFGEIFIGDTSTGAEAVVYEFDPTDGPALRYSGGMTFSPDGELIAFVASRQDPGVSRRVALHVIDLSGDEVFVSPSTPGTNNEVEPNDYDFSPDSTEIVYVEQGVNSRPNDMWLGALDGSNDADLFVDVTQPSFALPPYFPPFAAAFPRWSPDGSQVAYHGKNGSSAGPLQSNNPELYLVDADGTGLKQLETPIRNGIETSQFGPEWSPDGSELVFMETEFENSGGSFERNTAIALYDLDNDTTKRIAGSERLAFYPQYHRVGWSAERDSIVFAGQRASADTVGDYENAVWSVPVGGGTPQKLLVLDQFDQDPDLYLGLIPCSLVPPSAFAGLSPSRIMDTRSGLGVRQGFVGPRGTVSLDVTGVGGVPASGVEAVALNVTVARTSARSYLTVYPAGVAQPTASNMNWNGGGAPTASSVIVKVGEGGRVNFYNNAGNAHVIADVAGWFKADTGFEAITPTRVLDTREGLGVDSPGKLDRGSLTLQIHGPTVPPEATGVILNVTAPAVSRRSFVSVYPSGGTPPTTSSLNVVPGSTSSNLVITQIGADGKIVIANPNGGSHVVADVAGFLVPGSGFVGQQPTRLLDTRNDRPLRFGGTTSVPIRGVEGGVPPTASVAVLNVTAINGTARSYLTVYPGPDRPEASNVNFDPGQNVPNLVLATIAPNGSITVFNNTGIVNVAIDVLGYFE